MVTPRVDFIGEDDPQENFLAIRPAVRDGQQEFLDNLSSTDDLFYYQPANQKALVGSVVLHVAIFLILLLAWKTTYEGAASVEIVSGGIVMVQNVGDKPTYYQEVSTQSDQQDASLIDNPLLANRISREKNASEVAVDLPGGLPQVTVTGLDGQDDKGDLNLPSLEELTGSRMNKAGNPGAVQTGVFGTKGTGTRFIYVFDRSGSMAGYGGRPMAAAKQQLLASVKDLKDNHQFQIIFYNERATLLNPKLPLQATLLFGTPENIDYAQSFVQQIEPDGQTDHIEALTMALNLKPDVIFFLTDADEPQLTIAELNRINRRNASVGASINAIQFGIGGRVGRENFLLKLAQENGGQFAYVDLKQLAPIR